MENNLVFTRLAAEGAPYEVGRQMGELLLSSPELRRINILEDAVSAPDVQEIQSIIEAFSPPVNEELEGLTELAGVPKARLTVFSAHSYRTGACSHFCALPSITKNHDILYGRSYEWTPEDELNLMVVRETGLPAHIGFSLFLFGRMDGMNAHGFTVTMSSCEFMQPSYGKGLWFPLVLRILLNCCETVEDAEYLLKQLPLCCSVNLLFADRFGGAKTAEIACYGSEKQISFRSGDAYLVSTNHYENADMKQYDKHHGLHSELRYRAIENSLDRNRGVVTMDTVKEILGTKIPDGAACPYYQDGLGTLRSMVFNLTQKETEVCFGSPINQEWVKASFDEPLGFSRFTVPYFNELAENPQEFWRFIN